MRQTGILSAKEDVGIVLLAQGGSDRMFYRATIRNGSFVVMTAPAFRYEIRSYVDVGNYLAACGIGVPEIIACDDAGQLVVLEDLGDDSLHALLQNARTRQEVTGYYKSVLACLADLQMKATPSIETCTYLRHRSFGYEALRWETDYFIECFIKRFCAMDALNDGALDHELHLLASSIQEEPRYFMHRDFQSKNIYFKDGRVRIIDFQTATRGLVQYDLASLLKDAYFVLDSHEREELLFYYMDALAGAGHPPVSRDIFVPMFHQAGLQRNMQALGAFAFLSMNKGKNEFLQYIPAALACLREALSMFSAYPALTDTVEQAAQALKNNDSARA